jgi:AcrR family transcriptional regulator
MPRTIDLDARRIQLAEATWRVIREKGIGRVSVRTIASEAGVVVGSLRHVFPTRGELLEFSARLMIDRATERIAAIEPSGDAQRDVVAVLRELLPLSPDTRAELEVNLALIAETPALPQLAAIRDEADAALRSLCATLVTRLRPAAPGDDLVAERLFALVDGLALHLLTRPDEASRIRALRVLREEVRAIAGTPAEA